MAAAIGAPFFCGSIAFADNFTWDAPPGLQAFAAAANWNPSGPPGLFDIPVFSLNQANDVSFTSDHATISLEILQGSLTFQPDTGATPLQRLYSVTIDSFIHGGSLTLAGLSGPPARTFRLDLNESLFV